MELKNRFKPLRDHRTYAVAMLALIVVHVSLLCYSAWIHSPTLDEPAHLASGVHLGRTGDYSLYRVNPPLVRLIAAVPALLLDCQVDWGRLATYAGTRSEFTVGEDFVRANGRRSLLYFRLGRVLLSCFSVVGAVTCFLWAKDLYSPRSGLVAASLWCFSPLILGHGALMTPDCAAAALFVLASYCFWRWLNVPCWKRALVTGCVLGVALLSKTTAVLLVGIWPAIWMVYRWCAEDRPSRDWWWREAKMIASILGIGLYLLNLGYLGKGTGTPLGEFRFVSAMLSGDERSEHNRFQNTIFAAVPVPLPADYVLGIDSQQNDFESLSRPSYLRGKFQAKGWWYYYLYASLVKLPGGVLGLLGLTLVTMPFRRAHRVVDWRDHLVLLSPAIVIFIAASSKTGFSHHLRYVLPSFPFLYIWVSQCFAPHPCDRLATSRTDDTMQSEDHTAGRHKGPAESCYIVMAASALLAYSVVTSLWYFPHSLSYFNEFAGGPRNGAAHLLNSNIDWGQDLLNLEQWILESADPSDLPVHLAFQSQYNPFDLDVRDIDSWPFRIARTIPPEVPPGSYAIGVNLLHGYPAVVHDRNREIYQISNVGLDELRKMDPLARIGYSVVVYSDQQISEAIKRHRRPADDASKRGPAF
ncbi:Dolichyl-phosphate-mannose-protein mannosyltransferase [Stieleria maiorica]|uniref:Dolichyl-phosphate-mannose-protein mannosyltransferase n=1 Tax=Stieleria maiorica TaxID=2795974 RepID=A0A5B9MNJ2_9BACT|nr:glycosyltransferase family 39 protein [Stieleria maiorica]QEG01910.1 Dolichyl-phosphate-mannose-protein mannosyltransferase [Stieleria maiorica]